MQGYTFHVCWLESELKSSGTKRNPTEIYLHNSKVSILLWLSNFDSLIRFDEVIQLCYGLFKATNYVYVFWKFCDFSGRPPCWIALPSSSPASFFLISRKYCLILLFALRRSRVMSEYS